MRAMIFANGNLQRWPKCLQLAMDQDLLIAADGGIRHCLAWGIQPHVVIGDLDSAPPQELARLAAEGVEIIRHPTRKDETDLELALLLACDRNASKIIVLGGLGQRWDMTLANVMLLAAPFLKGRNVRLLQGSEEMMILRGGESRNLSGRPGDRLSLIPLSPVVRGVTLRGAGYPLRHATLQLGVTRGVSNLFQAPTIHIELQEGFLLLARTHHTTGDAP